MKRVIYLVVLFKTALELSPVRLAASVFEWCLFGSLMHLDCERHAVQILQSELLFASFCLCFGRSSEGQPLSRLFQECREKPSNSWSRWPWRLRRPLMHFEATRRWEPVNKSYGMSRTQVFIPTCSNLHSFSGLQLLSTLAELHTLPVCALRGVQSEFESCSGCTAACRCQSSVP